MTSVMTADGHRVIVGVLVTRTLVCCQLRSPEPSYFEIQVATSEDAPPAVLVTRDTGLYTAALNLEGSDQRIDCEVKPAKRQDGRAVLQVVALHRSV